MMRLASLIWGLVRRCTCRLAQQEPAGCESSTPVLVNAKGATLPDSVTGPGAKQDWKHTSFNSKEEHDAALAAAEAMASITSSPAAAVVVSEEEAKAQQAAKAKAKKPAPRGAKGAGRGRGAAKHKTAYRSIPSGSSDTDSDASDSDSFEDDEASERGDERAGALEWQI